MLFVDFMESQFRHLKLRGRVDSCATCGINPKITRSSLESYDYSLFTGQPFDEDTSGCVNAIPSDQRVTPDEAVRLLSRYQNRSMLLDVRSAQEFQMTHIKGEPSSV